MKIKISNLQLLLTVLFVSCLLVSNVIVSKQIQLPFDIVMPSAVILFPVTYVLSDVFSEVYGYKYSRFVTYIGFAMNLLMVSVFTTAIMLPAPAFYQNQQAFEAVLGNTPRILFASLTALMVGDFVNDRVFRFMKRKYPDSHKRFGLRAVVSSLMGELSDSLVFIPVAFAGLMPTEVLVTMIIIQPLIKTAYEVMILPFTTWVVKKVSAYEKSVANE
ncbi:queuosine precursor transporter [Aerococcaceae bacterium NML190073]|nr:queuosine precursor transporter [Aerococcaceae bacterium NML190073]